MSSDSEEDCSAGNVVAESNNHPSAAKTSASKPVGSTHIPELVTQLLISISKVTYSSLPNRDWVVSYPVLSRAAAASSSSCLGHAEEVSGDVHSLRLIMGCMSALRLAAGA